MGQLQSTPKRAPLGVSVVIISDTHGQHDSLEIPEADILIHAGDFTRFGREENVVGFNEWLGTLPHKHKVVVEGNHEVNAPWKARTHELLTNATFLRNEAVTCAGVRFLGKGFFWNMKTPNPHDDLCPPDTDILIAHNPCKQFVDSGHGCESSAAFVRRLRPRLFVCGHIHAAKGTVRGSGALADTLFVNGASVVGDHNAKRADAAAYTLNGEPILVQL
jgi:Icc-related predicted phosphoesterase